MKYRQNRAPWFAESIALFSLFLPAAGAPASAQTEVLTGNYDRFRTNANRHETILSPATVDPQLFGRLYSLPVDGQVYAQPLVVNHVDVPGYGERSLVIVATMRNSVYAFDADPQGSHVPLWRVTLGPAVPTANYSVGAYYEDLLPYNGILSTPVIDAETGTIYAVAAVLDDGKYAYRLHALDVSTGLDRMPPVEIEGEIEGAAEDGSGMVRFDAFWHLQRPGLLLANGRIYIAFGSHGGAGPYHGWIFAYNASDLTPAGIFTTSPDGREAAVWMSGRGLAADDKGFVYASTGNGYFDGMRAFGESVLKLDADLKLQSWFAPGNYQELTAMDNDLGACGPLLLPPANALVVGGKTAATFVLDLDELGRMTPGNAGALQEFQPVAANAYNMAFWRQGESGQLYVAGIWEGPKAYRLDGRTFSTTPVSAAETGGGIPYYGLAISSNGDEPSSGILWMTSSGSGFSGRPWPGTLRAFDANDLSRELWNSDLDPADMLPSYAKFATPTVANGLVYVPTFSNQVVVYGLKSTGQDMESTLNVANAFSQVPGVISPGELVAVQGGFDGPEEPEIAANSGDGLLPDTLGGVRVLVDGEAAPLVEVSAGRVVAVVPYSVKDKAQVMIELTGVRASARPVPVDVMPAHPGLQTRDGSGMGPGSFYNQDGALNSPGAPAAPGTEVSIDLTGVGPCDPPNTGFTGTASPPSPELPVEVTVAGESAEILSLEPRPDGPSAVFRLRLRVPPGAPEGPRIPVILRVGNATAPAVTLSVRVPPAETAILEE